MVRCDFAEYGDTRYHCDNIMGYKTRYRWKKTSVKVVIKSVKMGFLDQNIGIQDMKGGYKTVSEKGGISCKMAI